MRCGVVGSDGKGEAVAERMPRWAMRWAMGGAAIEFSFADVGVRG